MKASNDVTDIFTQTQRLCHDWFDLCRQIYFETWNCKTLFSNLLVLETLFDKVLSDRPTLRSSFNKSVTSNNKLTCTTTIISELPMMSASPIESASPMMSALPIESASPIADDQYLEQALARLFGSLFGESNYEMCYNKILCFLEQYEYAELLPLKKELEKEGEALHCECCFAAANAEWYTCSGEQDSDQELDENYIDDR